MKILHSCGYIIRNIIENNLIKSLQKIYLCKYISYIEVYIMCIEQKKEKKNVYYVWGRYFPHDLYL